MSPSDGLNTALLPLFSLSWSWSGEWWFVCVTAPMFILRSDLEIQGVKWPINLRLDVCKPLHRSHSGTCAVVSALKRGSPLLSREVIHPTPHPPILPSIQDLQWRGQHEEVFTSKARSVSGSAETSPRPPPQNPLRSLVSLAGWKNTGPLLLSNIKARARRGEDLYAGHVPLSGWSVFIHHFFSTLTAAVVRVIDYSVFWHTLCRCAMS